VNARKVKSKETIDDVASDDSNKDKDDTVSGVDAAAAADGRRKRQNQKSKPTKDKDGKVHRKRQTKNKVCGTCTVSVGV